MFHRSRPRPIQSAVSAMGYREPAMTPLPRLRFPILLVGLVMAVLLPTLAVGVVESELAAREVRVTSEHRLRGTAHALAETVGLRLAAHVEAMTLLANSPALDTPFNIPAIDTTLRRASATAAGTVVLLAPDGQILVHSALPLGTKPAGPLHVQKVPEVIATKQPLILNEHHGAFTDNTIVSALVPIIRGQNVVGVLLTGFGVTEFQAVLENTTQAPDLVAILLDGSDKRVAATGPKMAPGPVGMVEMRVPRNADGQRRFGLFRQNDDSGVSRLYAQFPIPGAPDWAVLASRDMGTIDAPWHLSVLMLGIGTLVALGLGTVLSSRIARLVLVPIGQIGRYAARVADANDGSMFEGADALPPARVTEFEALRRGFVAAESTLRKHVQIERDTKAALQESETRSSALLETLDLGNFLSRDMDGIIHYWSAGCEHLYGWTAKEAVGRNVGELLSVRWPISVDHISAILRRDGSWIGELQHRTRQGRELIVTVHETVRRDADGHDHVLEVLTDVTAQRRAEATLGVVLEALPVGVAIADANGHVFRMNASHTALWGTPPETPTFASYDTWVGYHTDTGERIKTHEWPMSRAIRLGETVRGEFVECERFGTGDRRIFITSAAPIRDPSGSIVGGVVADLDITDLRLIEDKLAQSEARLRTLIETVPIGLVLAEFPSGRIVGGNHYVETLVRHPVMHSSNIDNYDEWISYHADGTRVRAQEYPLARMFLAGEENPSIEVHYQRGDGTLLWLRIMGRPVRNDHGRLIGGVVALMDIDEEYRAREALTQEAAELERLVETRTDELRDSESRLAQAAKMEALGRLAGGVAHDFNNILQVVQGSADMAAKHMHREPDRAALMLGMISDAASRGMGVTGRLLAFARRSELSAGPIVPSALLEGLAPMLHSTLGPMVTLRIEVPQSVPALFADQAQLETVLVNLVNNARDALPTSGGRITLVAALVKKAPPPLPEGRYVRLSIADTGTGMPPEILARVSEPFFTTKGPGKGTGLGLAMARGFAEQSGGLLTIDSRLDQGTTVSLWLPVASEAVLEAENNVTVDHATVDRSARTGPSVLIVDDDPSVRAVLSSILDDEGYSVTEAEDSDTALSLLDTGLETDVLVTDLSMPGSLDGLGLVHAVRKRRAEMPAVLITGHMEESGYQSLNEKIGAGPFAVLHKPVPARVLCAAMEEVLAALTVHTP